MTQITLISANKSFGGQQKVYSHRSKELECEMRFAIYLPPQAEDSNVKLPVLYWLSGLTCDESNFIFKSGFQKYAAEHGIIVVCLDTSPRGVNLPGEDDSWDFGSAAGFYVDAITEPWNKHYKMFSYVTKEIIEVINHNFQTLENVQSISGHSMGGHGSLICTLRCPGLFKSTSAFAPISNPINCNWGRKAFTGYLGEDAESWKEYDATELVKGYAGAPIELFVDKGVDDPWDAKGELLVENLVDACAANAAVACVYQKREGYDHSYYYIASFIGEHIAYHARFLKQ